MVRGFFVSGFCALYLHSTGSDVQRLVAVRHSPAPALHWRAAFIIAVRHWTWDSGTVLFLTSLTIH